MSPLEQRLRDLAHRRAAHAAAGEALAAETREAVRHAAHRELPIAHIARLLDVDRSTLYRTYLRADAATGARR